MRGTVVAVRGVVAVRTTECSAVRRTVAVLASRITRVGVEARRVFASEVRTVRSDVFLGVSFSETVRVDVLFVVRPEMLADWVVAARVVATASRPAASAKPM